LLQCYPQAERLTAQSFRSSQPTNQALRAMVEHAMTADLPGMSSSGAVGQYLDRSGRTDAGFPDDTH